MENFVRKKHTFTTRVNETRKSWKGIYNHSNCKSSGRPADNFKRRSRVGRVPRGRSAVEKVETPAEAERRVAGSRLLRNLIRYLYERKSSATVYIVDAGTEQRKATSSQVSGILEILRGPLPTPGFEFLGKSQPLPATASARNLGSSSATHADTYEHKFSASLNLFTQRV